METVGFGAVDWFWCVVTWGAPSRGNIDDDDNDDDDSDDDDDDESVAVEWLGVAVEAGVELSTVEISWKPAGPATPQLHCNAIMTMIIIIIMMIMMMMMSTSSGNQLGLPHPNCIAKQSWLW